MPIKHDAIAETSVIGQLQERVVNSLSGRYTLPGARTQSYTHVYRRVSRGRPRILQGRVSNPPERGTGGRAPRGVRSGKGAVSPP